MKNQNQNNFSDKSYYEQGVLDESNVTPFHANMVSQVNVRVPIDDNGNAQGDGKKVLDRYERQVFENVLKKNRTNRQSISKEEMIKNPHKYGTMKNGKFVSFIDQFNEEKGIKTDRMKGASMRKRPKMKMDNRPQYGSAMQHLTKKGVR